jgi:hypothetical protein
MSLIRKNDRAQNKDLSKKSTPDPEEPSKEKGMCPERDIGCLIALILILFTVSLIAMGMAMKEELLKWIGVGSFWVLILVMRVRIKLTKEREDAS